jgi:hypothetical protein
LLGLFFNPEDGGIRVNFYQTTKYHIPEITAMSTSDSLHVMLTIRQRNSDLIFPSDVFFCPNMSLEADRQKSALTSFTLLAFQPLPRGLHKEMGNVSISKSAV